MFVKLRTNVRRVCAAAAAAVCLCVMQVATNLKDCENQLEISTWRTWQLQCTRNATLTVPPELASKPRSERRNTVLYSRELWGGAFRGTGVPNKFAKLQPTNETRAIAAVTLPELVQLRLCFYDCKPLRQTEEDTKIVQFGMHDDPTTKVTGCLCKLRAVPMAANPSLYQKENIKEEQVSLTAWFMKLKKGRCVTSSGQYR
eukprot:1357358-Amphidinium_carterae.1